MSLTDTLKSHHDYALVLPESLQRGKIYYFDLTANNTEFAKVDVNSTDALLAYTENVKATIDADLLVGKYLEDRDLYKRSELFNEDDGQRTIHLGMDLSAASGTPITTPLAGTVVYQQNEKAFGGYGNFLIIEHELANVTFYTLYGHLSRASLALHKIGERVKKGEKIAEIGNPEENGGWPSHLHFQVIDSVLFDKEDFIGVSNHKNLAYYKKHTADPNLILRLK